MTELMIKGGRVIDPARDYDQIADVLLKDSLVERIEPGLETPAGALVIEAEGLIVTPGLIDIHVHLRDPGQEYKEDIQSGTRAAAAGGFTALAAMANTDPVGDDPAMIGYVRKKAAGAAARVYPIGALTKGLAGREMAEIGRMKLAGAVGFSDDGKPVMDGMMMRNALHYASGIGAVVIAHEEDLHLAAGGMMHEGTVSSILGLRGIPAAAEEAMISRDLMLLKITGGRLHIAHLSTAGSVDLLRRAKASGLNVTAEVTPHHLLLTDRLVKNSGYNTNTKVNPPLRTEQDRQALWEGLLDGTIDVIASDHAPHHPDDKDVEYDFAPCGIAGLESTLPLMLDELASDRIKDLTLPLLIEKLSSAPARVLDLPGGSLKQGNPADVTIIDPDRQFIIEPAKWYSKSCNTPFAGKRVKGAPVYTIVGGEITMKEGVVTERTTRG